MDHHRSNIMKRIIDPHARLAAEALTPPPPQPLPWWVSIPTGITFICLIWVFNINHRQSLLIDAQHQLIENVNARAERVSKEAQDTVISYAILWEQTEPFLSVDERNQLLTELPGRVRAFNPKGETVFPDE